MQKDKREAKNVELNKLIRIAWLSAKTYKNLSKINEKDKSSIYKYAFISSIYSPRYRNGKYNILNVISKTLV